MSDSVEHQEQPSVVSTMNTSTPVEDHPLDLEQLHDYFRTSGIIDVPRLLKSFQAQDQMLRQTQLQVNELIEKNQLLVFAMPSKSDDKKASLTKVQHKYITQFSKCCVSTIDPWVDDSDIFQARESADNGLILSPEQYTSAESEKDALYAEVYAILKPEHEVLFRRNYGPARKRFIKCTSDGHSTFIGRIKNECFCNVFGSMIPSSLEKGFDAAKDPTCQRLLGYDAEKRTYSSLPPILWPDAMRDDDNRYIFRSETLMKILTATFFGSASLKEDTAIKKKPTNRILWGMNEITPGAIMFTAIMACFVLSGDERFDKHGGRSQIQYAVDFKLYKSTIVKYFDKRHMKDTVAAFNQFVFQDRGLDRNSLPAEEGETIEIGNDFSGSSGSDEEPFEVQGVNDHFNSEFAPGPAPGPSNLAIEELVDSVGAVTLAESNAVDEVQPPIPAVDQRGRGRGHGSKRRGRGKSQGAALASQPQAPPAPTRRSNRTAP
ncbi:hypothetical protein IW261DRAFT_1571983 [Armillaria novae-zelandiae]|uniref:Uncharacterized protein n=1 Tax=Armillaria novae-zelandiae TaxID=153914 RepID=A0AA39NU23_9AGAR|nr:hypothetical protein IW261DRAFT_1571983 [Armillaria novae-zelandiae]